MVPRVKTPKKYPRASQRLSGPLFTSPIKHRPAGPPGPAFFLTHRRETTLNIEEIIRKEYERIGGPDYRPTKKRITPKPCPRGNDPTGLLRCIGVRVEGVRVVEEHEADASEFGHCGSYCEMGLARCRSYQCRLCMGIRGAVRSAVRRARFNGMADVEIRAAKTERRCTSCQQVKSSTDFYVDRSTNDGLSSRCRPCHRRTVGQTTLPGTYRAADARRRARKANATVEPFTPAEVEELWGTDPVCVYCRERPATEQDHFVPLALGGEHTLRNATWPACKPCNSSKGSRHPFVWIYTNLMTPEQQIDFAKALESKLAA